MKLKNHSTLKLFTLLIFFFGIEIQSTLAQSSLDRISIADRSDGMGFVTRLHLTTAPDSFKVAHVGENYIQVVLYGVEQVAPRVLEPERPFVIEGVTVTDEGNGLAKFIELNLYSEQNVRISSYPDINGRDILISLFSIPRQAERAEFIPNRPLFGADSIVVPEQEETSEEELTAEEDTTEPEEQEEVEVFEETDVESDTESDQRGNLSLNITSWFDNFINYQNQDALNRITPDDYAWNYSRLIYSGVQAEGQEKSYLLRPENYSNDVEDPKLLNGNVHIVSGGDSKFQMRLYSPMMYTSYNKEIPLGQNDGALWQGKGRNWLVRTGVGVQYGPITAVLRPQFTYSQNLEFPFDDYDISIYPRYGGNEYQDYLMYADLPLRYGDKSFSSFHLADSYLQLDFPRFQTGISNERLWTGPAVHNPLIFSSNAPGFTHFFFRNSKPLRSRIGNFEGQYIWGVARDSDYFNASEFDSNRYINAITINYNPSFIPNFHMGLTRAGYSYLDGSFGLSDLFLFLRGSQTAEEAEEADKSHARMHLMSLYFRWLFPAADMEVYAEWGRNDYKRSFRNFISEPQLNRGYVLGFIKRFTISPNHKLVYNTEVTNLENSSVASTNRGNFNTWYESETVGQGFTHQGQIIGAGIGPGSSTQQMHLTYFNKWGSAGISAARIAHNMDRQFKYEDYFRELDVWPIYYFLLDRHEIEMKYGFHLLISTPINLDFGASYYVSSVHNRYNVRLSDIDNNQLSFKIRYNFSGSNR